MNCAGARLGLRLQRRFEPAGGCERRRATRARLEVGAEAVVDLEVAGGDRFDEMQHIAASHVSSNSPGASSLGRGAGLDRPERNVHRFRQRRIARHSCARQ